MLKHIILWTLRTDLSEEERLDVKAEIKRSLESLVGVVPGLVDLKVVTGNILPTSNCDLMLDSTLADRDSLTVYASHPAHVAVAENKVKPYTIQRVCIDFEI